MPEYDEEKAFRPTPEQYAAGDKEAYTPNSFAARCRHGYTNYDELLGKLDRRTLEGKIYYNAIRERIDELLEDHVPPPDRPASST